MTLVSARALRVASLLPSATENVCALLDFCQSHPPSVAGHPPQPLPVLVARSHECDFPASVVRALPVLTAARTAFTSSADTHAQVREALAAADSLYHLDAALLTRLAPDVVLTQSECRVCSIDLATVEASTAAHTTAQIVTCNPKSLVEALVDQFQLLGRALGVAEQGDALAQQHRATLQELQTRAERQAHRQTARRRQRVLLVEWLDPLFVGKDGWMRELVEAAGGEVVESVDSRDRVDVVVVALCGLSLAQTADEVRTGRVGTWWHELLETQTLAFAHAPELYLVDGTSHFTRPTRRLLAALEWLVNVLHDREGDWRATTAFPYEKVDFATVTNPSDANDSVSSPVVVDIEELHRVACEQKEAMYKDPVTGYSVLTAHFLRARQTCCGNCCRHCPYGHANVQDASRRTNVVTHDVFLAPPKRRRVKVAAGDAAPGGSGSDSGSGSLLWPEAYAEPPSSSTTERDLVVLFWSGGKDSFLALSYLYESYASRSSSSGQGQRMPQVVLLTTIDPSTNTVPVQNIDVQTVVAQAQALELPLYLVAVGLGAAYASKVDAALAQLPAKVKRTAITTLAFGDLHLDDIRAWREQAFAGRAYALAFPVWKKDYVSELLPALERLCTRTGARITYSTIDSQELQQRGWKAGGVYKWADVAALNANAALGIDLMGECGEFHTCVTFPGMV